MQLQEWVPAPDDIDSFGKAALEVIERRGPMPKLPVHSNVVSRCGSGAQRRLHFAEGPPPPGGYTLFGAFGPYKPAPERVPPPEHIKLRLRAWDWDDGCGSRESPRQDDGGSPRSGSPRGGPDAASASGTSSPKGAARRARAGSPRPQRPPWLRLPEPSREQLTSMPGGRRRHQWVRSRPMHREGCGLHRMEAAMIDDREVVAVPQWL
mmetsp:Transcript_53648/g.166104  ORF Transcript_53648/g.166104 Transcript_53648/m.166104 type:complete len:208 (+) Transcript_53648:217-840(+)